MGICLDTDANTAQESAENENGWRTNGNSPNMRRLRSANSEAIQMGNVGKIKFDPPKVPVIFVLGGPGSGKVTHCDTFMHEKRGVIHINMMDLLQQYAMGNDMQDFSQLSSRTVTEVLMLEMKMAPAAKAYLISGYPRSMRDVVEYSEKIQVVNGVILISWRQSVLQKQIDYGAKLGHVVLSLAKMELENFFKNVMPVADYFDQSDMLLAVNGERTPSEVYKDFRTAVLDILGALENQEAIMNGVTGMGKGNNDIPGSIVSVDTAPSQAHNIAAHSHYLTDEDEDDSGVGGSGNDNNYRQTQKVFEKKPTADIVAGKPLSSANNDNPARIPPVIWIIGGPGSNKASLCLKAIGLNQGWGHVSIGRILRAITDSAPRANTESYAIKESLQAGEMAPEKAVNSLLDAHLQKLKDHKGILIDGYPRNLQQVKYFEDKYQQKPPVVLLDCSKLQLGRGRIDDTVSSFRRRLELFRELTLPMLKSMDTNNRLIIVDGDTDSPSVQREFERLIRTHIQTLTTTHTTTNASRPASMSLVANTDAILHDLEDSVPGAVPTVSHHVSLANGHLKNRTTATPSTARNGELPSRQINFRNMLQEAERYPLDSYI